METGDVWEEGYVWRKYVGRQEGSRQGAAAPPQRHLRHPFTLNFTADLKLPYIANYTFHNASQAWPYIKTQHMEGIVPTLLPSPRQGTMVKGTAGPCIAYWHICICVFVCFCIWVFVCMCVCVFVDLSIYVFMFLSERNNGQRYSRPMHRILAYMYLHICVFLYCVFVSLCVCVFVYLYIYLFVYLCFCQKGTMVKGTGGPCIAYWHQYLLTSPSVHQLVNLRNVIWATMMDNIDFGSD